MDVGHLRFRLFSEPTFSAQEDISGDSKKADTIKTEQSGNARHVGRATGIIIDPYAHVPK